jgi:hypothetical protein
MIIGNSKKQAKGYAGDLITLTHQAKLVFTPATVFHAAPSLMPSRVTS